VKEDIHIPQVAISSAPSTYCGTGNGNGTAVAYVSNPSSIYYYEWYLGNQVKAQADHTGEVWNDLDPGFYTVKVTDRRIGTCVSTPATVEVLDASAPPAVIITQTAPLSNCDPNRPNAELRATVNGQVDGFKFAWYNENNQIVNIGAVAANLQALTYRVEALDLTTNCIAEATATVTEDIKTVPLPTVEVLSDMNRCDVPDGAAGAHVGGSTTDHIFNWYTQQGKPVTHEINHIAENLMAGAYYITATDRKTGCVSDPVSFSIADKTFYQNLQFQ
jgi:hypothetical protein